MDLPASRGGRLLRSDRSEADRPSAGPWPQRGRAAAPAGAGATRRLRSRRGARAAVRPCASRRSLRSGIVRPATPGEGGTDGGEEELGEEEFSKEVLGEEDELLGEEDEFLGFAQACGKEGRPGAWPPAEGAETGAQGCERHNGRVLGQVRRRIPPGADQQPHPA